MRSFLIGILTSTALISSLITVPVTAQASTQPANGSTTTATIDKTVIPNTSLEDKPLVKNINLETDQTATSTSNVVKIKATVDKDLSYTHDKLSIVNKDDNKTVKECDTGTECSFDYNKQAYAQDPTFYARTTNLNSNTVQVTNDSPSIQLESNYTEVQQYDYFALSVKYPISNLPSGQWLYIANEDTDEIVTSCSYLDGGDSCSYKYTVIGDDDTAEFKAYIANAYSTNKSNLVNISEVSNPVEVNRTEWAVNLTTKTPIINEGAEFTMAAKANQYLPSNLAIWQYDITDDKVIGNTGRNSLDEDCDSTFSDNASCFTSFSYAKSHKYKAVLADRNEGNKPKKYSDFTNIKAESSTLTIKQLPFMIKSFAFTSNGSSGIGYKGSINQPGTNYYSAIIDAKTNKILELCNNKTDCETQLSYPDGNSQSKHDPANGAKFVVGRWSEHETLGPPYAGYEVPGFVYDIQASVTFDSSTPTVDSSWSIKDPNSQTGGSNPSQPCAQLCEADPINTVTGEFWLDKTDLTLKSLVPLSFSRSYAVSKRSTLGNLGYGWNSNLDLKLSPQGGSSLDTANKIIVSQENGSTVSFVKNDSGKYTTDLKTQATLEKSGSNFVFVRNYKTIFTFNSNGVLTKASDLSGNSVNFTYTNNKLTSISNGRGQQITIAWNAKNLISSISNGAGKTVKYTYTSANELSKVEFPDLSFENYYYDSEHAITSFTDKKANTTSNSYDENKRVVQQTDAVGNITAFEYSNYETTITQPNGRVDKHYYNEQYQVYRSEKAVDSDEAYNEYYEYDAANNLISTTYPDGGTTEATYDANGNVLQNKDRAGNINSFTYDAVGNVLTKTNPKGKTANYTYDAKSNLISSTDYSGNVTQFTVNTDGTNSKIVNADNSESKIEYNQQGLANKVTDALGGITSQTYNTDGQVLTSTDAKGNTTSYTYNTVDKVTSITYPNTSLETFEYDKNGNVTKITDRNGKVTTYSYDALNRQISSKDPLNRIVKQEYDSIGNVSKTTDALNYSSTIEYDSLGRQKYATNALGNTTEYDYNELGQVIKVISPTGRTVQYGYDANGNISSTINGAGVKTSAKYDYQNKPVKTYDEQQQPTSFEYDSEGNLITTKLPNNTIETSSYDNIGQVTSYVDSEGKTKHYEYDRLGRLSKFVNTDESETSYEYDANGNLTKETAPDASSKSYEYSTTNQLVKETTSDEIKEYAYDASDRRTQEKQGTDTYSYTYDAVGNMLTRNNVTTGNVAYGYNARNEISSITYPSAKVISYTYTKTGKVLKASNTQIGAFNYTYDEDDNKIKVVNPNGTNQTFGYNDSSQITDMMLSKGTASILSKNYSYSAKSGLLDSTSVEVAKPSSTTISESYGYDSLMRLSTIQSDTTDNGEYINSNSGNLINNLGVTQNYNQANQLVETNTSKYAWDGRGNLTSITDKGSNAEKRRNSFNGSDQLIQTTTSSVNISYTYDVNGLTKSRASGSVAKKFIWNENSAIPTLLDDGDFEYFYTDTSSPVAQINKSSGAVSYLHSDASGSIIGATNSTGTKTGVYFYSPYGSNKAPSGSTDPQHSVTRFGYKGEWKDPETGLYNMRARWYDSSTGIFVSRDPLEIKTKEAYSYASNNPISNSDPSGKFSIAENILNWNAAFVNNSDYNYEQWREIGSAKDMSPQEVMREFRNHPKDIFPFPVKGCETFEQGSTCHLEALGAPLFEDASMTETGGVSSSILVRWANSGLNFTNKYINITQHGNGDVTVKNTCTSTVFTVSQPGYFVPVKATIGFQVKEKNGKIYLVQTGNAAAKGGYPLVKWGVKLHASEPVWDHQAERLRNHMKNFNTNR